MSEQLREKPTKKPSLWPAKVIMPHVTVLRRLNPLTPMSNQDGISPNDINTISSRQVMRIIKKFQLGDY